jgi:hypothetical protein
MHTTPKARQPRVHASWLAVSSTVRRRWIAKAKRATDATQAAHVQNRRDIGETPSPLPSIALIMITSSR